jgi:type I restriction enzyme R subunit
MKPADRTALLNHVSGLPSTAQETDELPLRFDWLILKLQQLLVDGERDKLLQLGGDLLTLAEALADDPDLTHVAQVQTQRPLLEQILDEPFWNELTPGRLEDVRLNLRSLMRFVPRQEKVKIYTDFDDKLLQITEKTTPYTPTTVNVELYKKKLSEFIKEHQDMAVIGKLRRAEPITAGELFELETFFQQVGQFPAQDLLHQIYNGPRHLGRFVRQAAGLDQPALARLLSQYINQNSFNSQQIYFIQTLLEYTAAKGHTQWTELTEWPFTDKHPAGVFGLFDRQQQTNLQQWLAYVAQTAEPGEI